MNEKVGQQWLEALSKQKLEVTSARDALAVKGYLDTGNYALNWAISGRFLRGYPLGHAVEIFGDQATGKSYLIIRALSMVQSIGGVALLDDIESAYNLEWIRTLGVNPDTLGMRNSKTVNEHLQTARAFLGAYQSLGLQVPGVLACDSLAALSTEHELEVGLDKRDMTKAAELKAFFRIIRGESSALPVVYLATNHTIANIGSWSATRTTPGGGGPKFHSSIRLDLRATSKIKTGNEPTGVITRIVVDKTRFTAPWKEVRLAIPFYRPVSRVSGLIPLLLDLKVLTTTKGHNLVFDETDTGIPAHKTKGKFLQQDQSAELLIQEFPDLLPQLDDVLSEREVSGMPWKGGEAPLEETNE